MLKKSGLALVSTGILIILFFAFADSLGFGNDSDVLGPAQFLGIEVGAILVLLGIGMLSTNLREQSGITFDLRTAAERIVGLPFHFWITATFLTLYLLFFISPMFFSAARIQYFTRYIPDAWTTRIGFDIETTVSHVESWLATGDSPYEDGVVPYTPLTLALFTPLLLLGYPGYYQFLTVMTVCSYVLATFLIPLWVNSKKELGLLLLFGITGLFSYGFQFELERGQFNMIAFAACLLAIYIFHSHHSLRYFAYLLFSLAVQLKLYPAIFVILLVKDWRDWKNNLLRITGLGIFNFLLLFVLGHQIFSDFVKQIAGRQFGFQSSRYEDLSISGFTYFLSEGRFGTLSQYADLVGIFILALFGTTVLSIVVHLYKTGKSGFNPYLLVVCTIAALMIPAASFDYKLPILVPPLIIFFSRLPAIHNPYKKAAAVLMVIFLSIAFWSTLYPYEVKSPAFYRNSPALLVILLAVTALYFLLSNPRKAA